MAHLTQHHQQQTGEQRWNNLSNCVTYVLPLDFSVSATATAAAAADVSRTTIPISFSPTLEDGAPAMVTSGGVVDLSTRGRSSTGEDSSCASSVVSDKPPTPLSSWPLSPTLHETSATITCTSSPLFTATTTFKKSPSTVRPFKAYPRDPMNLPIGLVGGINAAETMLSTASNEAYAEFRRQMLAQVVAAKTRRLPDSPSVLSSGDNGISPHHLLATHAKHHGEEVGMLQQPSSSATDHSMAGKDPAYWERRRKNNEAAKRSRDARRNKEDEIAIRAAFLEQENLRLKYEVATLRNETTRLRCVLYASSPVCDLQGTALHPKP